MRLKSLLITIIIVYALGSSDTGRASASTPGGDRTSIGDIIAVEVGQDIIVYLTIPDKQAIFSYKLIPPPPKRIDINQLPKRADIAGSLERIDLTAFTRVPFKHEFKKPIALAYRSGKLLICDSRAVFEADIKSNEVTQLIGDLDEPESISVTDNGLIAIADDSKNKVFLYKQTFNEKNESVIEKLLETPENVYDEVDRMAFIGDDLLVLDSEKNKEKKNISLVTNPELDVNTPAVSRKQFIGKLTAILSKVNSISSIQDFRVRDGIYYLVDKTTISALVPNSSQKTEQHQVLNPKAVANGSAPRSRMTSTRDELLIKEEGSESVIRVPRPVPARVNFEIPNESGKTAAERQPLESTIIQQRKALADLYNYLYDIDRLPTKSYKSTGEYPNGRIFLRDPGILKNFLLDRPSLTSDEIENRSYLEPLTRIFCRLNESLCIGGEPSKLPIQAGQIIKIPNIPVENDYIYLSTYLLGKSVKEHLAERVITDQQPIFTSERLLAKNKGFITTTPSEEILDLRENPYPILLPATVWYMNVFVNGADYFNKSSDLRKLLDFPGVSIDSEQKFPQSILSSSYNTAFLPEDIDPAKANRDNLLKSLSFDKLMPADIPPYTEDIYIALVENLSNIRPHKDLTGVWYEKGDNNAPSKPLVFLKPEDYGTNDTVPGDPPVFHGNHVGGIISSHSEVARGLLPSAKLFFINNEDADSTPNLKNGIRDAINAGVKIFNLSFARGGETTIQNNEELLKTMQGPVLFIAAAGNDGKSLDNLELYPIKWSASNKKIQNVLGVGAVDDKDTVFVSWKCNPDASEPVKQNCPGTNTGKQWVQIVAQGLNIYSTAFANTNEIATGTSQAAPQVTAAAAALYRKMEWKPGGSNPDLLPLQIKARLIYTTDWLDSYSGDVWGGKLNFYRAVAHPMDNVLINSGKTDKKYSFWPKALKVTIANAGPITPTSCFMDVPTGKSECPEKIEFLDILRIQMLSGDDKKTKVFRIIYLGGDPAERELRILRNVTLEAAVVPCNSLEEIDAQSNKVPGNKCSPQTPIQLTDIWDYTAAVPGSNIRFF
jgi:hypothetical protein